MSISSTLQYDFGWTHRKRMFINETSFYFDVYISSRLAQHIQNWTCQCCEFRQQPNMSNAIKFCKCSTKIGHYVCLYIESLLCSAHRIIITCFEMYALIFIFRTKPKVKSKWCACVPKLARESKKEIIIWILFSFYHSPETNT